VDKGVPKDEVAAAIFVPYEQIGYSYIREHIDIFLKQGGNITLEKGDNDYQLWMDIFGFEGYKHE
jgi:hypothetical protein